MRSKYWLLIIFIMAEVLLSPGVTAADASTQIVDFKIIINGITLENQSLEAPIIAVDGDYYYPLTHSTTKAIGFNMKQMPSGDLYLLPRSTYTAEDVAVFAKPLPWDSLNLTRLNVNIYAYGYPLASNREILMFGETVYVALQDTPALKHTLSIDSKENIHIEEIKAYARLPYHYSIYNFLDSEQLLRNQGNAATCWAYAANSLFEIAVAKDSGVYENFSESHMLANTPIPVTYESGGHFGISSIYYLNHLGPKNLQEQYLYNLLAYQEINYNLSHTKSAIFQYGAVISSIHLNDNDKQIYNSSTGAYFNPYPNKKRSHELILVGWDDSYSRDNFSTFPSRDGAFIAQNSFGNQWGKEGFLYISYDDVHILTEVYALSQYEPRTASQFLYLYDKTGTTHFETYDNSQTAVGINVFTSGDTREKLQKISFKTAEKNTDVEIYYGLYENGFELKNPLIKKTLSHKGHHTLKLSETLMISPNSKFWIAVRFTGDSQFLVPIESPYPGIGYAITANKGESYIGDGTTFVDLTEIRDKANVAIRVTTQPLK